MNSDGRLADRSDPVEVAIDGFAHGGEGVGRIEGKVVLVAGALPGERVRVRVTEDHPRWSRAELLDVLVASADRVTPPCVYVGSCGGCDLQHVRPDAARALKTRVVREQLARLGRLGGEADRLVEDCRIAGPDLGYRNHVQLHADADGRLGFHRAGSHDVVPIDTCIVADEQVSELRTLVGDGTGAREVSLRALGADRAVVLTPGPGSLQVPEGEMTVALRSEDRAPVVLRGAGLLHTEVAGIGLRVPLDAFFQVNSAGAEALVALVLELVGDVTARDVWDLYAGVGLLALPLARAGAHVLAVESGRRAAAAAPGPPAPPARPAPPAARLNAELHGLDVTVVDERVEKVTARGAGGDRSLPAPEIVVADPPRAGLGRRVVEDLVTMTPERIVLVACDVASLARDVRDLTELGYRLERAVPLDLFPMTHHVETVAAFRRARA
jgi:tRNA/tmRNA/rRNA uracil-C5-methylase (TrmA/RlmC/RlmD family)